MGGNRHTVVYREELIPGVDPSYCAIVLAKQHKDTNGPWVDTQRFLLDNDEATALLDTLKELLL